MEHGQRAYEDFSEPERKAFAEACMVHGYREIDFLVSDVEDAAGLRRVAVRRNLVTRLYDGDRWIVPFTADLEAGAFDAE